MNALAEAHSYYEAVTPERGMCYRLKGGYERVRVLRTVGKWVVVLEIIEREGVTYTREIPGRKVAWPLDLFNRRYERCI